MRPAILLPFLVVALAEAQSLRPLHPRDRLGHRTLSLHARQDDPDRRLLPRDPFIEAIAGVASQAIRIGVEQGAAKGAQAAAQQGVKQGVKNGGKLAGKHAKNAPKKAGKEGGKNAAQGNYQGMPARPAASKPPPPGAKKPPFKPGAAMQRVKDRWHVPGRKDSARAKAQEIVRGLEPSPLSFLHLAYVCDAFSRSATCLGTLLYTTLTRHFVGQSYCRRDHSRPGQRHALERKKRIAGSEAGEAGGTTEAARARKERAGLSIKNSMLGHDVQAQYLTKQSSEGLCRTHLPAGALQSAHRDMQLCDSLPTSAKKKRDVLEILLPTYLSCWPASRYAD